MALSLKTTKDTKGEPLAAAEPSFFYLLSQQIALVLAELLAADKEDIEQQKRLLRYVQWLNRNLHFFSNPSLTSPVVWLDLSQITLDVVSSFDALWEKKKIQPCCFIESDVYGLMSWTEWEHVVCALCQLAFFGLEEKEAFTLVLKCKKNNIELQYSDSHTFQKEDLKAALSLLEEERPFNLKLLTLLALEQVAYRYQGKLEIKAKPSNKTLILHIPCISLEKQKKSLFPQRRTFRRVRVKLLAHVLYRGEKRKGYVLVLSEGGAWVEMRKPEKTLSHSERVGLEILLPQGLLKIDQATVVHVHWEPAKLYLGLQFLQLSSSHTLILKNILEGLS